MFKSPIYLDKCVTGTVPPFACLQLWHHGCDGFLCSLKCACACVCVCVWLCVCVRVRFPLKAISVASDMY